jgi:hypothetical protein
VRKTRASHITFSDKLLRLHNELLQSLALAEAVVLRERAKLDCAREAQNVWEKRLKVVELKRKFPTLGEKADEELLQDKERPPKVPRVETSRVFSFWPWSFPANCSNVDVYLGSSCGVHGRAIQTRLRYIPRCRSDQRNEERLYCGRSSRIYSCRRKRTTSGRTRST